MPCLCLLDEFGQNLLRLLETNRARRAPRGHRPLRGPTSTAESRAGLPGGHAVGTDTWTGTLVVPSLEFDLTPPTITGAVDKIVRAPRGIKRMRVTYKLDAADAVDGSVPVSCKPKSGSRFKIGRTLVRCSATDRSANTRTASFMVIVKARR